MHIDHINIRSSAEVLDRVRDFYCHVLDLSEGHRPNFSSHGYWLYADRDPVIHLSVGESCHEAENTGCLDHVAFRVSDLDPIVARLDELGVEYRLVEVKEISMQQLFFRDPAGVKIELNCLIANRR